jgi:protein SCO1/2
VRHALLASLAGGWLTGPASAQIVTDVEELGRVKIVEHLDETLPLDLRFVDEEGRTVRLGEYFHDDRPVLLSLNYYGCPMLCGLQLNGLVDALQDLEWTAGERFEIVTVSIDPRETSQLARLKKQSYLNEYGRPEAGAGWHFLTGAQPQIDSLAAATGFGYQYLEESGEYSHAAVAFVATPEGRLSRYLYGVVFDPTTLRYSLVEAGEGRIGSTLDQIILYCFHYDASAGAYTPVVMNIMRVGALLCAFVLALILVGYWWREARRRRMATVGVEL